MPKWCARIWLEVQRVWVERLQDITPDDIAAEGLPPDNSPMRDGARLTAAGRRMLFAELWDSIYGSKGYAFDSNPWVRCVEFRRVEP